MLDLSDIQGNILKGYTFPFARFVFINCADGAGARGWLATVVNQVTTAENWGNQRPSSTFNIAFTFPGLERLGVGRSALSSFSDAFREGMASRSNVLGDVGESDPSNWESQLGSVEAINSIHGMISVYGNTVVDVTARLAKVLPTTAFGVTVVLSQDAGVLPGRREHFGFRDGLSQPPIEGGDPSENTGEGTPLADGTSSDIAVGEFLLGYPGQGGIPAQQPTSPFGKNASYVVYRKLQQDVTAFRKYVATAAQQFHFDPEWLASRIVGRWKDGTPIVLSPNGPNEVISGDSAKVNDFRYSQDPTGLGCPLGAHIRRTNPRDGLQSGINSVNGHRLLRRGIPYGQPLPDGAPDSDSERGLLFIAFNASLRDQFEFVQRLWLNDSGFTGILDPAQKDLLAGNNVGTGTMTVPVPGFPRQLQGIPSFVTLRFGVYLFVPGIEALRTLSQQSV